VIWETNMKGTNLLNHHYCLWIGLIPFCICAKEETTISDSSKKNNKPEVMVVRAKEWSTKNTDNSSSRTQVSGTQFDTPAQSGIERLSQYTANMMIEDSSVQSRIIIRGQSSIDTGLNSPVGYILDDIPLPLGAQQAPDLLNVDSVEIIKGAQGSNYGRSSEAGLIKVSDNRPSAGFSGWSQYSYLSTAGGNGEALGHQFEAGINGGNDNLSGTLAFSYLNADSPYYNLYRQSEHENNSKQLHIQGGLDYTPTETTDILYRTHWQETNAGRATMRYLTGNYATNRFHVNQDTLSHDDKKSALHSIRINHDLNRSVLTTITGYTQYRRRFTMDPDCSSRLYSATESLLNDDMISQELRLSALPDESIKWSTGTYLYRQNTHTDITMGTTGIRRVTDNDQYGIAGFGHTQISLGGQWSLTTGVRIEYTQQQGEQNGTANLNNTLTHTEWMPNIGTHYQLNPMHQIYLNYATGYLPGGFNYSSATSQDNFSYGAEHTQSFELGHQGNWLNQRIQNNLVLFYSDIHDKQVIDVLPGMVQKITNASNASIYGIESALNWDINNSWTTKATLGLQHGETHDSSISGKSLTFTPNYTWSLAIDYTPTISLTSGLQIRGSDRYFFNNSNSLEQSSYQIVDMNTRYQFGSAEVIFAVNNLFDETVYSRAVSTSAGVLVEDTQPRTFSVSLNYQW
jgi:iron complex outermembrane recepter protein